MSKRKDVLHIYTRVSTTVQKEEGTSIQTQKDLGIKKSKELGMSYKVWNEGGRSSHSDQIHDRPVLTELFNEIRNGRVKFLYVFNTDRLSRNETVWVMIKTELKRNNVILFNNNGQYDLSDPTTELLVSILGNFSQYDNTIRTMRSKLGKFQKIKEGYWLGGPPPFGYKLKDKKLEVDEKEKKWVKYIFDSYVQKKSFKEIEDTLIKNGVKTRRGNLFWSRGSLQSLLRNTHYFGSYKVKNHDSNCEQKNRDTRISDCSCESYTVDSPKMFTKTFEKKFNEINEERQSTKVTPHRKKKESLLNDVLKCGVCGDKFYYRSSKTQSDYYMCRNQSKTCNKRNINMDGIDNVVWDLVVDLLTNSNIYKERIKVQVLTTTEKGKRKKEIDSLFNRINKINDEVTRIDNYLLEFKKDTILGRGDKNTVVKMSTDLQKEKEKLVLERESINQTLSGFDDQDKWVDWTKKFGDKINTLKSKKFKYEDKKVLINEMVDLIVVDDDDKKTEKVYEYKVKNSVKKVTKQQTERLTKLKLKMKLPVIEDDLIWKDPSNKRKGYSIKNGKKVVNLVYKIGLKKTEIESITYGT